MKFKKKYTGEYEGVREDGLCFEISKEYDRNWRLYAVKANGGLECIYTYMTLRKAKEQALIAHVSWWE